MSVTHITSRNPFIPDLAEAWRHYQLALVLAHRNIKARYTQTLLGSIWIVVQPILLTGVFTLIFGTLLAVPTDGMPYIIFAFSGTAIWSSFQRALSDTGMSLAQNSIIVMKVYFPRLLVPVSSILTALVDLVPVYLLLVAFIVFKGWFAGWPALLSPLFLLLAMTMALGLGFIITSLDAVFRDIRLVVPTILQLAMYLTPVMFSESIAPARLRWLFHVNPMLGLVEGFRWSLVMHAPPPAPVDLAWSVGFTLLSLILGAVIFTRLENFAVDRI
ncbi:MAG TPA: ABC transporter permease [Rhizomicrobium sp.]|nr:ABC transporter permease [Rhizomicrobium sp.]